MYYVYLLRDNSGKIYIGFTQSLDRRMSEHKNKKVYWTSRMDKPELIYYEAYPSKEVARDREKKLKTRSSAYVGLIKRIGIK